MFMCTLLNPADTVCFSIKTTPQMPEYVSHSVYPLQILHSDIINWPDAHRLCLIRKIRCRKPVIICIIAQRHLPGFDFILFPFRTELYMFKGKMVSLARGIKCRWHAKFKAC